MNRFLSLIMAISVGVAIAADADHPDSKPDMAKPYSMMARASKVIEAGETAGDNLIFKAAICADWAGDTVKSRDYLVYFLDKEKGDSPEIRRALVRLCLAGGSPDYYKRYLSLAPHDLDALAIGITQLRRLVEEGKSRDYYAMLGMLVGVWPTGWEFSEIVHTMHWAVHDMNVMGIHDGKGTVKVLTSNRKWEMNTRMEGFLGRCFQRQLFSQDYYDLYKSNPERAWPKEMYERLAGSNFVPEAEAIKLLQRALELYGHEAKNQSYFNGFWRLHKAPGWTAFTEAAKAGKFPAKAKIDRWAANRKLQAWREDWSKGKFAGRPEEALKRAKDVFVGVRLWDFENAWMMRQFIENTSRIAKENPAAAKFYPFEELSQYVFETPYYDVDAGFYGWLLHAYEANGNLKGGFDRIEKAADHAGSALGVASLRMAQANFANRDGQQKGFLYEVGWDWTKKSATLPEPVRDRLLWNLRMVDRFAKAPIPELIYVSDMTGAKIDVVRYVREHQDEPQTKPEDVKYGEAIEKYLKVYGKSLYANGCRRLETHWGADAPVEAPLFALIKANAKDPQIPFYAGATVKLGRGTRNDTYNACTNLIANGQVEIAYLLAARHRELEKSSELQKVRTEAASRMPGLYPVNDKDPAYPLYVAADALARNNPERAWTLLSANTKVFDKDPMRYQPQFALWALEQYRKVRGPNDVLRDKAWDHVETLLQKEASYPVDVVAGLFLLRAEIAEDRLQYEVAHAGYLALRNHAQYKNTPAGRQAMFKDVELMMAMGSLDGAAQTAEQWITTAENDIRAQGHYVLAKIAFARKDYEETRKELEKVFEIDFTHAEARLLHGEWKLATNYEVDDPQVLLGRLQDRTTIRPGQPLSITVQDKNLAVAGGGASIPVIVTTSVGKDAEKILLYPGTRDPSLFKGSIDTVIGVAKVNDAVLQLSGDDQVAYRIDPAYLRGRDLKADAPKTLSVVDDADLTIGTGDESRNLKPGLPLHLTLVDRDRSRHAAPSTVEVALMTSSGDRLKAQLRETGRCTGVFTAEVKTALPPPRAFASDSTAGMLPSDLISKTREGVWQSLQDGAKPKSVGVDTMSSHLVSSASVEMPSPETVARLRLFGTLLGEETLLGSYPAESAASRRGIQVTSMGSNARNLTDFIREAAKRNEKPVLEKGWTMNRTQGGHSHQKHLMRGTVFVPQDTQLRIRLRPIKPDTKKEEDTLRWLTYDLMIDGARVLGCNWDGDMGHKNRSHNVFFEQGLHELEVYAFTWRETDSFELCQEMDDGELVPLPKDWIDDKAHPELLTRFSDKCRIEREKGCFVAKFDKPERLRTLRWEFTDFIGKSVSVSKLHMTDKTGREVIPSDHDYTEALGNSVLEVAPGDTITATYEDDVTSSGRARAVEKKMSSAFADGTISFLCEDLYQDWRGTRVSRMYEAYRIAPGDTVFVKVHDPDLDATPGADRVKILVESTGGKKIALYAKERLTFDNEEDEEGHVRAQDQGDFYAQIRTVRKGMATEMAADMIELGEGEGLKAAYKDEDNIKPGVPVLREAVLSPVHNVPCELTLANTWADRTEDKSFEGKVKLSTIRRRKESAHATQVWRTGCYAEYAEPDEVAMISPEAQLPIAFKAPALIRHSGSKAEVKIATQGEIEAAATEGRDVNWQVRTLRIGVPALSTTLRARRNVAGMSKGKLPDTFYGFLELYSSAAEERAASADDEGDSPARDDEAKPVDVKAGDVLVVRYEDEEGKVRAEAKAKVATTAWMGLADVTYTASNPTVHLGETFHVMVVDPDRDVTDEQDVVEVKVVSKRGESRTLKLKETMARSGVFTGSLVPSLTPAKDEEFKSGYGDELTFEYEDTQVGKTGTAGTRTVVGQVLPGSDGNVRAFSKRFRDADQAVLVQFRLAECLFEMAKDYRKLKETEKSAAAIADGRRILESALRDYPHTTHAAEGEFLLANLYEQLAEEERASRKQREKEGEDLAKEDDRSLPLYREAVSRFAAILSAWPDGEYAARSQYHKALCLERLGDFSHASEEYVKMTYIFPDSPLVGDASVRLASYYYNRERRYDIAAKIYTSFRNRFPAHPQAPNALFMGGQCLVKQAEALAESGEVRGKDALLRDCYKEAVASFISLVDNYKDNPNKELLAQSLYWAGDISFRLKDYPNAYIYLKRTTFEYPESKWARYARGMLLQEAEAFEEVAQ